MQAPGEHVGHVGERQRGDDDERHDRRRQHEQHRHEDELRRHEVAGAGLELEVAHDRGGEHEQHDVQRVDVAVDARGRQQHRREQERDADDRVRGQLAPLHRLVSRDRVASVRPIGSDMVRAYLGRLRPVARGRGGWTFDPDSAPGRRRTAVRSDRPGRAGCAALIGRSGLHRSDICRVGRARPTSSLLEEGPSMHLPARWRTVVSAATAALAATALTAAPAAADDRAQPRRLPRRADRPAVRPVAGLRRLLPRARTATSRRARARWQLEDGARAVEGNEPFVVGAAADHRSLRAAGRRVRDDRADVHRRRAPDDALLRHEHGDGALRVEALYTKRNGKAKSVTLGAVRGTGAWAPSHVLPMRVNELRRRLRQRDVGLAALHRPRQRRRGRSTTSTSIPYQHEVAAARRAPAAPDGAPPRGCDHPPMPGPLEGSAP